MQHFGPVLLLSCFVGTTAAQSWDLIPTPSAALSSTYSLEVDATESQFVLFASGSPSAALLTSTGNGTWNTVQTGDHPKAFYANDGSLFLLKDLNPSSSILQPQVFRSTDNGVSLTEIPGVVGSCFYKDAQGIIFLSTATGFKYSTNSGVTFTEVATPFAVTGAALDADGVLYYGGDSLKLFQSDNGGNTWMNISKNYGQYDRIIELQVFDGVFTFNDENGSQRYGVESDAIWSSMQPGAGSTSWVGDLRRGPDALFVRSPYGLYSRSTWAPVGWDLLLEGIFSSQLFGSFLGNYSLSSDHVYAKVDSGFVSAEIASFVSVPEIAASPAIRVFPNPAADHLFVSGILNTAKAELAVHDATGRLIHTAQGTASIEVNALPAGIYVITVVENGRKKMASFAKE